MERSQKKDEVEEKEKKRNSWRDRKSIIFAI